MSMLLYQTTRTHKSLGIVIVEVIVGISILALVLIFISSALSQFINLGGSMTKKTQALFLAEEGLEVLRYVRDDNWSSLGTLTEGTMYGLSIGTSTVAITTTPEVIGDFRRSFEVRRVYRLPANDDIVASTTGGAVVDAQAKYVTTSVQWGSPTTSVSLTTLLTNFNP